MPVETSSLFSRVIEDHLALKERNARLDPTMPIDRYKDEDPFDNHPLFKTEEQARIEDTMTGQESIDDVPTPLAWPTDDTFVAPPATEDGGEPAKPDEAAGEPDAESEEGLWSRSRDFDWGD
jgi:hypothetical protein